MSSMILAAALANGYLAFKTISFWLSAQYLSYSSKLSRGSLIRFSSTIFMALFATGLTLRPANELLEQNFASVKVLEWL